MAFVGAYDTAIPEEVLPEIEKLAEKIGDLFPILADQEYGVTGIPPNVWVVVAPNADENDPRAFQVLDEISGNVLADVFI